MADRMLVLLVARLVLAQLSVDMVSVDRMMDLWVRLLALVVGVEVLERVRFPCWSIVIVVVRSGSFVDCLLLVVLAL